jgi:urease accessory protein UreF
MAYVDDELAAADREELQTRLAREPELARQVASYQKLAVMARQIAPAEPLDLEWDRIQKDPAHRVGMAMGWTLLGIGILGSAFWYGFSTLISDLSAFEKLIRLAPCAGFSLIVLIRWRDRQKLAPLDPYTDITR